jgi:plastocyanin
LTAVAALSLPAVAALSWLALAGDGSSAATKPAATCTPEGTALSITANDNKYDKDCLATPADQAFTIDFDNQDAAIPHNVSIYDKGHGDKALFTGEITYGPKKITYSVPAQAEGTYEFRCDPHADFMFGTFIVGNGGPTTTTTATTAPPPTTTTTSLLNLPKILPGQPRAR